MGASSQPQPAAAAPAAPPHLGPSASAPFSADYEELLAVRVTQRSLKLIGTLAGVVLAVAAVFGFHVESEVAKDREEFQKQSAAATAKIEAQVSRAASISDSLSVVLRRASIASEIERAQLGVAANSYQNALAASVAATATKLGEYDAKMHESDRVVRDVDDGLRRVSVVRDSLQGVVAGVTGRIDGDERALSRLDTTARSGIADVRRRVDGLESRFVGSTSVVLTAGNPITIYGMDLKIKFASLSGDELQGFYVADAKDGGYFVKPRLLRIGDAVQFADAGHEYRVTARYRAKHRWWAQSTVGLQVEQFGRDPHPAAVAASGG